MASKGLEGYPSDVTDEKWAFVLPYHLLCREDNSQRFGFFVAFENVQENASKLYIPDGIRL